MRKQIIRALVLMLCCVMLVGGMTSCRLHKVAFDAESNQYVDGRTDIRYTDAPGCYEPVAIGKEYAKIYYNRKASVTLHEVGGMSSEQMASDHFTVAVYDQFTQAVRFAHADRFSVRAEKRFLATVSYALLFALLFGSSYGCGFGLGKYRRGNDV